MAQRAIKRNSKTVTRPAPNKGIDSFNSIATMPEGYAVLMRNFIGQPFGCAMRKGYVIHATGLGGAVESLISHNKGNGIPSLYAFANAKMSDVTVANAVPVQKLTSLTNNRWQSVNFANISGVNLIAVNGADDIIWISPTDVITRIVLGSGTGNTILNVDPKVLIDVYSHQKRLWFVQKNTTLAWYLPPDQLSGVATSFNPGVNWTRGGYLNQIVTWTLDDGNGSDDNIAFFSSEGEVSIYQGTDPNTASTFSLRGVFYCGAPIGRRAATRKGGDILVLTQLGIVYLSDLLKSTKINPDNDDEAKYIQNTLSELINVTGDLFGWQPFSIPADNLILINAPVTTTRSVQLVMNDITGAWSELVGFDAYSWELHKQRPFIGAFGAVHRAFEGYSDGAIISNAGALTIGADITADAQTSFSYFEASGQQKHFKLVRPTIICEGEYQASVAVNTDFTFKNPGTPISDSSQRPGRWSTGRWDSDFWGGGLVSYKNWTNVNGIGTAGSLRLTISSRAETYWATTDWLYEIGGIF